MHRFLPLLTLFILPWLASCGSKATKPYRYEVVPGKTAIIRDGYAIAPASAPEAVKRAIAAGNRLQGKPYIYGGGHRRIEDVGYDCSGTASYVLYHAGLISGTTTSTGFMKYGKPGPGKWITLYTRRGHVFTVIAGLRLDTGYNGQGEGPRWSTAPRPSTGCVLRHPPGL